MSLLRAPLLALVASAALAGCAGKAPAESPAAVIDDAIRSFGVRGGELVQDDPYGETARELIYLDQGWGPAQTLWYYHADQGSMLFPYALFVHLEQADNAQPFIAPEHMARYRFLAQRATPNNPDALPVGFARHDDHVGLTCAACHTSQIQYQGTAMRIDGGPAMIDMIGFLSDVLGAIRATQRDPEKLDRFVAALGGGGPEAERRAGAERLLEVTARWLDGYLQSNGDEGVEGFGRLDAVGRIVNQCIRFTSSVSQSLRVTAPASFPVLWDAPRHDYVQWAAFGPNAGAGGLGRNAGEVLGVFGQVEVTPATDAKDKAAYKSSIEGNALVAMESALYGLQSPLWPEAVLGPLDRELAARGAQIYQAQCVSCHALIDRDDPDRRVVAQVYDVDVVGTDPTEANLLTHARVPSGVLKGTPNPRGGVYGDDMPAIFLIGNLVQGVLRAQPDAVAQSLLYSKANHLEESPKQGQFTRKTDEHPTSEFHAYKARPLNGVWASAPYLHNGSVPSLYDMLLPPEQRHAAFVVGRLEYDPVRVGYVHEGSGPGVVDTTLPGNYNRGHLYGTALSADDRHALLEYLKTL